MPAHRLLCPDAVLVRPLGPHTWLGRLPNGHELAVLLPRARPHPSIWPAPSDRVTVEISPADFSHGRVLPPTGAPPRHESRGLPANDL